MYSFCGPQLPECVEKEVSALFLRRGEPLAAPVGVRGSPQHRASRCRAVCGRLLPFERPCEEQCRHPLGHESFHSFECLHTLPPEPPSRPPPV